MVEWKADPSMKTINEAGLTALGMAKEHMRRNKEKAEEERRPDEGR